MAEDKEPKKKGLGGMGKMGSDYPKKASFGEKKLAPDTGKEPKQEGGSQDGGEEHQTTITHHADGTHSMSHSDGSEESHHPHHLHMLAHLGHHLTGGDEHHVTHHDGMEAHEHHIDEMGQHSDGPPQQAAMGQPAPQEPQPAPAYGGMGM